MTAPQEQGSLFRMASFRLTVLGVLFSMIAAVVVFALIYKATGIAAREELAPIVAGERAELLSDAKSDSLPVAREIALGRPGSGHAFYAVTNAAGHQLAGNIPMPPDADAWRAVTRLDEPLLPPEVQRVDGITTSLPDGEKLFIGEDASVFATLNRRIALLFAVVFGAMIGLGLLASLVIAAYSVKRVRAISAASADIVAGDLSRRIETYGIDDELDVLTANLNRMLETIEQLVENARQATSDIAHDLRSPLTRLRDHLVRIERLVRAQAYSEIAGGLQKAIAETEIVISIFVALLRIAEIEAGALQGQSGPVDLSALQRELGEEFIPVAEDEGQSLTLTVEAGIWVHGDAALLSQMLVNLIENAIRHCPRGTAMTLSLARAGDGMARTEMTDTGPGIPEAEFDRVFQRFTRLDRSRHMPGHGLGLPLVRAITLFHAGSVKLLDNRPGLCVRIELPCIQPNTEAGRHGDFGAGEA